MGRRVAKWDRIFPSAIRPTTSPRPTLPSLPWRRARGVRRRTLPTICCWNATALSNYSYGDLDTVHDMLNHDATIVGLGDGGAHVGVLCDSSAITYMLTHWTRDRTRGTKFPLPWAIRRVTRDSANAIGLRDRGVLAPATRPIST
jgi:hypothetical protein